jgi:alkylation response protein AidB-like acyl-CoA dehydrogenase
VSTSRTVSTAESAEAVAPTRTAVPGGSFLLAPVVGPIFTRETFSDEQREIDRMVREFARGEILPRREELQEHDEALTRELLRHAAELGLTAIDIPEEYGGLGLDKTTSALVVEALTTGMSASWVVTFSCHVGIGSLPIVFFGSDLQKERFLPGLGSAELLGAYALTEPGAGSDVNTLATTATPTEDGSGFVLDGTKQFVTNGGWADVYVVFAALQGRGVTAFLVEKGTPGLTPGPEEHKLGIRGSSTTSVELDGVRIPAENLLGEPGGGLEIALNILNVGRFKLGAADLGGCKASIDLATGYALERLQFGQPIAYFEAIRKKLAEMVVRTYMLDGVIYRTVGLMDQRIARLDAGDPDLHRRSCAALEEYAIEASIAKVLGSETMSLVADQGIQIYGGYGFIEEYPLAAAYRDTRIDRIFEGTNEINRMVVYGYFLRKALMEELPLREAVREWDAPVAPAGPLGWEVAALETGRRLTVKCLFEAISRYGQDLRNEQVVGEDLADLAIGYYAASSAVNRLLQLGETALRDRVHRALARLVVATYLEDAWRIFFRLRPVLFADAWGARSADAFDARLQALHLPFDPVAEIRLLTDDLFDRGRYRFE